MSSSRYRVLDVDLGLAGPESVVRPIDVAYRRFRVDGRAEDAELRIVVRPDDPGEIVVDGRARRLVRGVDVTLQTYQPFLELILDRIQGHAVLHAGAIVAPDGGAVILAGPSGLGKSSLTLEMVRRGHALLSDDYAPVELGGGTVAPYPRSLALLEGRVPLPEPVRVAMQRPGVARLFGKALIDAGDVFGDDALAHGSCPLRHVIVLSPRAGVGQDRAPATTVEMAIRREDARRIFERLDAIAGVERSEARSGEGLTYVSVRLEPGHHPTRDLSEVLDDEAVLFSEKTTGLVPDFDAAPVAEPMLRREAALELGRELLNRRAGSRLMRHYPDGIPALFLDLAATLRGARCWHLAVGRFEETADRIEQLIDAGPRRDR